MDSGAAWRLACWRRLRVGAEAMIRVAGVTTDARSTASDVKDLADSVAVEAEGLESQVRQFLSNVHAA